MSETIRPAAGSADRPPDDPSALLLETLCATVERFRLFSPGHRLLIGASGGPDSTALLHALTLLSPSWNLTLAVAHFNHGFRGEESEAEARYVASLCARLSIPTHTRAEDVPARKRRQHLSSQEAARRARHEFLRSVADEIGADRIALGHTQSDRVETVVLNLLRGAGVEGIAALPPARDRIIRPLIEVTRAQTAAYCAHHALAPCADSSNSNLDYRRNRLRSELLPYLATYYNERVENAILRFSDIVSDENLFLEQTAAAELERVLLQPSGEDLLLDAKKLKALPVALQRRVLRMAIRRQRGHLQGIGFDRVDLILASMDRGEETSVDLPAADAVIFRVRSNADRVAILRSVSDASPLPWQTPLCLFEERVLPGEEWAMTVFPAETRQGPGTGMDASSSFSLERRPIWLVFDRESLIFPLAARSWRPGDRIRRPGMNGSKKLQDLFTDRKVPVSRRFRTPVLTDAGGEGRILAVAGVAVAETQAPFLNGALDWPRIWAEGEKYVVVQMRPLFPEDIHEH